VTAAGRTQAASLARRSVLRTLRQPASIVPSLLFPLILLAVNSGGLTAATEIPGFPTDSYLDFALAFTFMQGAIFATMNGGTDLARDIQTGFLNRLALTPLQRGSLLAGQLAGVVFLGLVQAVVYLVAGLVFGASIAAGVAGALLIFALAVLVALAFGAIGALMALRTGSGEAVQALFPLLFALLFLSSMFLPRDLIESDWFRVVASLNPVSYLIEAFRSLIVTGWDAQALLLGFGLAAAIAAAALLASAAALKTRLARS
jgi:ABC-2 type transport system permease protein